MLNLNSPHCFWHQQSARRACCCVLKVTLSLLTRQNEFFKRDVHVFNIKSLGMFHRCLNLAAIHSSARESEETKAAVVSVTGLSGDEDEVLVDVQKRSSTFMVDANKPAVIQQCDLVGIDY